MGPNTKILTKRYTSICGYIQDVKELVAKLINQGFDKAALRNRF